MIDYLVLLPPSSLTGLANHLWQSSLFALGAWLLAVALRRNQARVRYVLWMVASLKFLLPFSLLVSFGELIRWQAVAYVAQPALSPFVDGLANPFPSADATATISLTQTAQGVSEVTSPGSHHASWLLLLVGIWTCGTLLIMGRWIWSWWQLRTAVGGAKLMTMAGDLPVLSMDTQIEPGIFGIFRPVLLLPAGITERLTPAQLGAVVAHEMCHVRRRDNLTATLHMVIEALFWFNPVVWGIGFELVRERESACDESVLRSEGNALAYAESILSVCKFCVEAPLPCVSGVGGADLKKRIARILEDQVGLKLNLRRKLVLGIVAMLIIGIPVFSGLVRGQLQAQVATSKTEIAGTWQGTLHVPQKDLRTVLKITGTAPNNLKVTLYSIDQGGRGIPASSASFEGGVLKYAIEMIDGSYEGRMSGDGNSITGTWKQGPGAPLPLVLVRATPATEWSIPEPPPRLPAMAADANPSFEVATIKPSKPDQPGKLLTVRPNASFGTINTTTADLINFAYDVQAKQVVNAPDWMGSEKFDIEAKPDSPGMPTDVQLKAMVRKLLADRFELKFHEDKKEMSAYVLAIAKNGPKLKKSEGDPNGLPGLFFRQLGYLTVQNATMANFVHLMQSAVLDRPVVDQTGLDGRWDFVLKWTPDESQFGGMGMKVPPPSDAADAPPPLFTAIQEQIGLKLEAGKAPVPVLVLDHLEKPSAN